MDPYTEVWFPDLVSCPLGGLFSLFRQLSLWRRANARNVSFFTLYGGQFTFSTQLLTSNDLLYSCTYFSDVIKMMDVFSILQEATSDDNLCPMNIGWAPFLWRKKVFPTYLHASTKNVRNVIVDKCFVTDLFKWLWLGLCFLLLDKEILGYKITILEK